MDIIWWRSELPRPAFEAPILLWFPAELSRFIFSLPNKVLYFIHCIYLSRWVPVVCLNKLSSFSKLRCLWQVTTFAMSSTREPRTSSRLIFEDIRIFADSSIFESSIRTDNAIVVRSGSNNRITKIGPALRYWRDRDKQISDIAYQTEYQGKGGKASYFHFIFSLGLKVVICMTALFHPISSRSLCWLVCASSMNTADFPRWNICQQNFAEQSSPYLIIYLLRRP